MRGEATSAVVDPFWFELLDQPVAVAEPEPEPEPEIEPEITAEIEPEPEIVADPDARRREREAARRARARAAAAPAAPAPRRRRRTAVPASTAACACVLIALVVAAPGGARVHARRGRRGASLMAERLAPANYIAIDHRVAIEYGLEWYMLAAVGEIESHNGTSQLPGVSSGENYAGAAGPAQFIASTWARYGVDADPRRGLDPYDPVDAITAMAAYLKASGAPQDWPDALYAYNHSWTYVESVLAEAARLRASTGTA